jgi:hypothetical protein
MGRRGGTAAQQTAGGTRSVSTQAQAPKKVEKTPMEEWDLLIIDVSKTQQIIFYVSTHPDLTDILASSLTPHSLANPDPPIGIRRTVGYPSTTLIT